MITNCRTVQVKQNCMDSFAARIHAEAIRSQLEGRFRIYKSDLGIRNILALEIDFDDFAAYDTFWRHWATDLATPEFGLKYDSMVEHDLTNEVWDRVLN